jgi:uncharacterized protein
MRRIRILIFISIITILLDVYIFQAVKTLTASSKHRQLVHLIYWGLAALCYLIILAVFFTNYENWNPVLRTYLFALLFGLFISKFIIILFLLVDDIRRGFQWLFYKLTEPKAANVSPEDIRISRSNFLSWLGIGVGTTLFGTLVYGFSNKYNYKIRKQELFFTDLPQEFDGFNLVQLSDIHSGSFTDKAAVAKGVAMINALQPELVLFTGDIVNDRAKELIPYKEVFNKVTAPLGVYSVLGNHDYGDYVSWDSPEHKKQNLINLIQHQKEMGWQVLVNDNVTIKKGAASIALVGIENWGAGNFAKYGNLSEAFEGVSKDQFTILMSHDPSHWNEEVTKDYPSINLTLSGHTHGAQFGVELPGFKWSPVKWRYKQWAGLYQTENKSQSLYVNRGFGFIGYPGRVGILPEITQIILRKGNQPV